MRPNSAHPQEAVNGDGARERPVDWCEGVGGGGGRVSRGCKRCKKTGVTHGLALPATAPRLHRAPTHLAKCMNKARANTAQRAARSVLVFERTASVVLAPQQRGEWRLTPCCDTLLQSPAAPPAPPRHRTDARGRPRCRRTRRWAGSPNAAATRWAALPLRPRAPPRSRSGGLGRHPTRRRRPERSRPAPPMR
jgi:hypothetical protein